MRKTFLLTTAVALIASAGMTNAQTPGASGSQPAPATTRTAPVENTAPMTRGETPDTKAKPDGKASQADPKMPATTGSAQRPMDDAKDGVKSKGAESKSDSKAVSETKTDKSTDVSKDGSEGRHEGRLEGRRRHQGWHDDRTSPGRSQATQCGAAHQHPHRDQGTERQAGDERQLRDHGRNAGPAIGGSFIPFRDSW